MRTIRELREAAGMTRAELAERVGVKPQSVYYWEQGRKDARAGISARQLRAVAQVFGMSMDDIALPGEDAEGDPRCSESEPTAKIDRSPGTTDENAGP